MIILTNPDTGAPIDTIIDKKRYVLAVNETLGFQDEVAKQLLNIYGFLIEEKTPVSPAKPEETPVLPEKPVEVVQPVSQIPNKPVKTDSGWKCPVCEYSAKEAIAVLGHIRGHKEEEKRKLKENATKPASEDVKEAEGETVVSMQEKARQKELAMYGQEGSETLPEGKTDRDGVEWTGKGLEQDTARE